MSDVIPDPELANVIHPIVLPGEEDGSSGHRYEYVVTEQSETHVNANLMQVNAFEQGPDGKYNMAVRTAESGYEQIAHVYLKWDGCGHIWFGDNKEGYLHLCGRENWEDLAQLFPRFFDELARKIEHYDPETGGVLDLPTTKADASIPLVEDIGERKNDNGTDDERHTEADRKALPGG